MIAFGEYLLEGLIGTAIVMIPIALILLLESMTSERESKHPTETHLENSVLDRFKHI